MSVDEEIHDLKKKVQELEGKLEYSRFMIKTLKQVIDGNKADEVHRILIAK